MKDKRKENAEPTAPYTGKTYAYVAIGLCVAGAAALGLIFTKLGIYALLAAIILSLAALAFANTQKRKNNFGRLKIVIICAYVLLGVSIAVFIGGLIWSAAANP